MDILSHLIAALDPQSVQKAGASFAVIGGLIGGAVAAVKLLHQSLEKTGVAPGLVGKAKSMGKNLGGKTQDKLSKTGYFADKQNQRVIRDNLRKQSAARRTAAELNRGGVRGWRARLRAGGATVHGREEARRIGAEQQRKEHQEEVARASQRLRTAGFSGDADYLRIAQGEVGKAVQSDSGTSVVVSEADRQAAINTLAEQGRVSPLRRLERDAGPRGPRGVATNEMQRMLDEAYVEHGGKLGDKAPDLVPDRRSTGGYAAFTDVEVGDVSKWHSSTVDAAAAYYNPPAGTNRYEPDGTTVVDVNRELTRTLNAFGQATTKPTASSEMNLSKVTAMRQMMNDAITSGRFDMTVVANQNTRSQIEQMYASLGGT